ncbi:MAG: MBL fold metallo-hydrolase [Chloroflexi bacterium]|nr:MBL fold metallo-hydrolase [Chloroflexota bacterium]
MANVFRVGEIEITVVSDGEAKLKGTEYFPASTPETWAPHKALLDDEGYLTFPFTCFVIRSGERTVLIDTGLGPLKSGTYRGGDLMGELASAGVRPDDIDTVFITHLHADHCGSAALRDDDKQIQITFPNATYRWTSAEQAYWSGELPPQQIARRDIFAAVAPRWNAADGGASLAPGVDVYSIPGHTPGHAGVVVSSGTGRAFILGDGVSCPVQLTETDWSGAGDVDPALARAGQEAAAREAEGSGALFAAAHFPGLTFGRVLRGNGKRYWSPV